MPHRVAFEPFSFSQLQGDNFSAIGHKLASFTSTAGEKEKALKKERNFFVVYNDPFPYMRQTGPQINLDWSCNKTKSKWRIIYKVKIFFFVYVFGSICWFAPCGFLINVFAIGVTLLLFAVLFVLVLTLEVFSTIGMGRGLETSVSSSSHDHCAVSFSWLAGEALNRWFFGLAKKNVI